MPFLCYSQLAWCLLPPPPFYQRGSWVPSWLAPAVLHRKGWSGRARGSVGPRAPEETQQRCSRRGPRAAACMLPGALGRSELLTWGVMAVQRGALPLRRASQLVCSVGTECGEQGRQTPGWRGASGRVRADMGQDASCRSGSDGRESTVVQETWAASLGREGSWRRKWQPSPGFLPGDSRGQRSLVGCSPWGRQESDTAERLTLWLPRDGAWADPPGADHWDDLRRRSAAAPSAPVLGSVWCSRFQKSRTV